MIIKIHAPDTRDRHDVKKVLWSHNLVFTYVHSLSPLTRVTKPHSTGIEKPSPLTMNCYGMFDKQTQDDLVKVQIVSDPSHDEHMFVCNSCELRPAPSYFTTQDVNHPCTDSHLVNHNGRL